MAPRAPADRPRGPPWRWLRRQRWLLARRGVQIGLLLAFMAGPWWGVHLASGTLASSEWFGLLRLTDPFVLLQSVAAGHRPERAAVLGALLVAALFGLLAGRLYCSWVCPINLVTDLAARLRRWIGLGGRPGLAIDRRTRHVILVLALVSSAAFGTVAWELVNPITLVQRALVFGLAASGVIAAAAIFLFDLLVSRGGWCGHLCPVGAFYGWLGRRGRLRVVAARAGACTQCGDCYRVCPEPHVIVPVLRPGDPAWSLAVTHQDCLRCGRCLDVCDAQVFVLRLCGSDGQPKQASDTVRARPARALSKTRGPHAP